MYKTLFFGRNSRIIKGLQRQESLQKRSFLGSGSKNRVMEIEKLMRYYSVAKKRIYFGLTMLCRIKCSFAFKKMCRMPKNAIIT